MQLSLNRYVYFYSPDLVNFDDIASSENLLHLTANRPKMPGRRLPGRFNGAHSVSYICCCEARPFRKARVLPKIRKGGGFRVPLKFKKSERQLYISGQGLYLRDMGKETCSFPQNVEWKITEPEMELSQDHNHRAQCRKETGDLCNLLVQQQ